MKVKRCGSRNPIPKDFCIFLIYDETQTVAEPTQQALGNKRISPPFGMSLESFVSVLQNSDTMWKAIRGRAYGHPSLTYFTVHKDGTVSFEFDDDIVYSEEMMLKMIRLARAAKRRCEFLQYGDTNGPATAG